MTSTTKKNIHKCTQDIRSIPPARYALPTDGRKADFLCKERRSLLMQMSSYANGDGTNIKVSTPELAKALGCSRWTIQRRLKELKVLGFLADGEIDGYFHTRVRAIDIQQVTDSPNRTGADSQGTGADSQGIGADTQDSQLYRHITVKKPSLLTEAGEKKNVVLNLGSTTNDPLGGCGNLSSEALAKKTAGEKAEEDAKWKTFTSKKEWLAFVEDAASRLNSSTEIISEFLPNGAYRVLIEPMMPSLRNGVLVGYVPRSLRGKKTRITDAIYLCRYDKCENYAGALSLYCPKHEYGYEHSAQATGVTVLDNSPVAAETGSCEQQ